MRFIYFTDTHIRGTNPKNRKDNFSETLENKLLEIKQLIHDYNVDYVLHGGDIFDRPDVSLAVAGKFAAIFRSFKKPIYTVVGNHDIFGYNSETLDRSMLGFLKNLGFINVISSNQRVILSDDKTKVQLSALPYSYDIDSSFENYVLKEVDPGVDFSINLVHGMLLEKPFIKDVPHTLIEDIYHTKADITISGHYHAGFKTIVKDNKYFLNPGSLVRIANSIQELSRMPKVLIITLDESIDIKELELKSALPGDEVLDRQELEKSIFKTERMYEFKQTIEEAVDFEKLDIFDLLNEVASSDGMEDIVKKEAVRRISSVFMDQE